ncbi:MAG: hypothetical protein FJZ01_20045 [Candidatus Sericytochromatia bacterium]|nr:hypothetical protein [Candidatus Tanganyikabacteria bacterium]
MSALQWLYVALAVATAAIGAMLVVVLWQVAVLLATVRAAVLPQIQTLLTDTQKSLVHVESITQDVEHKLARLDDSVEDVTVATHSVATAAKFFGEGVAKPFLVNVASILTGAGAAWRRYREIADRRGGREIPSPPDSGRIEEKAEAKGVR